MGERKPYFPVEFWVAQQLEMPFLSRWSWWAMWGWWTWLALGRYFEILYPEMLDFLSVSLLHVAKSVDYYSSPLPTRVQGELFSVEVGPEQIWLGTSVSVENMIHGWDAGLIIAELSLSLHITLWIFSAPFFFHAPRTWTPRHIYQAREWKIIFLLSSEKKTTS